MYEKPEIYDVAGRCDGQGGNCAKKDGEHIASNAYNHL
jgi:hypothetical protein